MTLRYIERYRYHFVAGLPIVALLASSLSFSQDPGEDLCITAQNSRYVTVGEQAIVRVIANADEPINTVSGTIRIPAPLLEVGAVTPTPSILDLWAEAPTVAENGALLRFSGGTTRPGGFTGTGTVITFTVTPLTPGEATIRFEEAHMFAHNGTGQEVSCAMGPMTFFVRDAARPSPDVNDDARVDIFDLGTLSARMFLAYDRRYDLNTDGKVGIDDLVLALRYVRSGNGALASLTLFWR